MWVRRGAKCAFTAIRGALKVRGGVECEKQNRVEHHCHSSLEMKNRRSPPKAVGRGLSESGAPHPTAQSRHMSRSVFCKSAVKVYAPHPTAQYTFATCTRSYLEVAARKGGGIEREF